MRNHALDADELETISAGEVAERIVIGVGATRFGRKGGEAFAPAAPRGFERACILGGAAPVVVGVRGVALGQGFGQHRHHLGHEAWI